MNYSFDWGVIALLTMSLAIMAIFGIAFIAVRIQLRKERAARARRDAAIARYRASLTPEDVAEIERVRQIAQERPWEPIAFALNDVKVAANGFSFCATGVHRGRPFGFGIAFTRFNGPVALCEWSRNGAGSEALLDILTEHADVPRDDSRFDDLVKTSAIILQATPSNVPFAAHATRFQSFFRTGRRQSGDLPESRLRVEDGTHRGEEPDEPKKSGPRVPRPAPMRSMFDSSCPTFGASRPVIFCSAEPHTPLIPAQAGIQPLKKRVSTALRGSAGSPLSRGRTENADRPRIRIRPPSVSRRPCAASRARRAAQPRSPARSFRLQSRDAGGSHPCCRAWPQG
jgi:hypothetical protein